MLKTIKACCVNGALYPLEPVELQESGEYLVTGILRRRFLMVKGGVCCGPLPGPGGKTARIGSRLYRRFTKPAALALENQPDQPKGGGA